MRQIFGVGYLEKETQLPFLIGYIFMCMYRDEQMAKQLGLRLPRGEGLEGPSRELLETAAYMINAVMTQPLGDKGLCLGDVVQNKMLDIYNVAMKFDDEDDVHS